MTVSSIVPRSIVVFAPMSTSSPMTTRPSWGTASHSRVLTGEAEPIAADDRARMHYATRTDYRVIHDDNSRPEPRCSTDLDIGADYGAGIDRYICADLRARTNRYVRADVDVIG